jgi:hypothetical protein
MIKMKYFIGPMSKNVVDTIIDFCNETNNSIGLIPSRRQVEWDGGYVNNWTTDEFTKYVKSKSDKIILQRDHSGPGQGKSDDDGYSSLEQDCKYLNLIHIDPWKKYPNYNDGLKWTIDMMKFCNDINPNLGYEIGTEESLRQFEVKDLEQLIIDLQNELGETLFSKIKYLVIQSGTSLKGNIQTGQYDKDRLTKMVNLAKKYNLLSKEHNADYISIFTLKEKFSLGLNAINIAPEFGLLETQTYLDNIKEDSIFNKFWEICYESKKWVKWVNVDFDPLLQKEELIKICGHYILTNDDFINNIKIHFPNIDKQIKNNIKNKLNTLYGY